MKTYTLTVPDAADEAAVQAALAGLLARNLIVLEPEEGRLFDPVSEEAFAGELRAALQSPALPINFTVPRQPRSDPGKARLRVLLAALAATIIS